MNAASTKVIKCLHPTRVWWGLKVITLADLQTNEIKTIRLFVLRHTIEQATHNLFYTFE